MNEGLDFAAYRHVHISRGVSKLGANIPSVSLPPVLTCRADAPCTGKCYARKGRFSFLHMRDLLLSNLAIWNADPIRYKTDVAIAAFHNRFFRWHASGDIPNATYLAMMVELAAQLPGTRFLCFTKKFELVNTFISENGMPPENLRIVFSAWGDFVPDNPHNLPMAYVRFKTQQTQIPASVFSCPNFCGECVLGGSSCWDLRLGESVCFDEH